MALRSWIRLLRSWSLDWGWSLVGSVVGVASSRASMVWRARRQLTRRMTPATMIAAIGSAYSSHGSVYRSPAYVAASPSMTASDAHMSVAKWMESAARG